MKTVSVGEARELLHGMVRYAEIEPVLMIRGSKAVAVLMSYQHYLDLLAEIEHLQVQCAGLYAKLHPEEAVEMDDL